MGASFAIRAFSAMWARLFSKGIGDEAVATGAYPNLKYKNPNTGSSKIPMTKPAIKTFSQFSLFPTITFAGNFDSKLVGMEAIGNAQLERDEFCC